MNKTFETHNSKQKRHMNIKQKRHLNTKKMQTKEKSKVLVLKNMNCKGCEGHSMLNNVIVQQKTLDVKVLLQLRVKAC
jgi:hypothetical protein